MTGTDIVRAYCFVGIILMLLCIYIKQQATNKNYNKVLNGLIWLIILIIIGLIIAARYV